jgi:hypothetical protein
VLLIPPCPRLDGPWSPPRYPTKYPLPSLHRDGRIPFATSSSDQEWPANRVRQTFMDYFVQKHGHTFFPSSPVVPLADPTLLFANAGMNQYKPIFLGQADPNSPLAKLERAVNSQVGLVWGVGRCTYLGRGPKDVRAAIFRPNVSERGGPKPLNGFPPQYPPEEPLKRCPFPFPPRNAFERAGSTTTWKT